MHLLGKCKHRYGRNDYCDLTVIQTRFGPGHVAPPKFGHYPRLTPSSTSAPAVTGHGAEAGGGHDRPVPGQRGSEAAGRGVRRAVPVKAG